MNFSLKLCGVGAISFGLTAGFVTTVHGLGFPYEIALCLILFGIGALILVLAGWALYLAIYGTGLLLMGLFHTVFG